MGNYSTAGNRGRGCWPNQPCGGGGALVNRPNTPTRYFGIGSVIARPEIVAGTIFLEVDLYGCYPEPNSVDYAPFFVLNDNAGHTYNPDAGTTAYLGNGKFWFSFASLPVSGLPDNSPAPLTPAFTLDLTAAGIAAIKALGCQTTGQTKFPISSYVACGNGSLIVGGQGTPLDWSGCAGFPQLQPSDTIFTGILYPNPPPPCPAYPACTWSSGILSLGWMGYPANPLNPIGIELLDESVQYSATVYPTVSGAIPIYRCKFVDKGGVTVFTGYIPRDNSGPPFLPVPYGVYTQDGGCGALGALNIEPVNAYFGYSFVNQNSKAFYRSIMAVA